MSRVVDSFVVHSFYAHHLLAHVRARGGDDGELRRRFALPRTSDEAPALTLTLGLLRDLSRAAEELLGDPFIGLHVAHDLDRGGYGIFGLAVDSAPTLRAWLEQTVRYAGQVIGKAELFDFEAVEGGGRLTHRYPAEAVAGARHQSEFFITSAVLWCRRLLADPRWSPRRVTFGHPAPPGSAALAQVLGTDAVEFERDCNSVLFDADALARPIGTADPEARPILEQQARLVARLLAGEPGGGDESFVDQVRRLIQRDLGVTGVTIDGVALALRTSPRTLQRRLADAGTSFAAVLDALRQQLARQHLRDPRMTLDDVAARLGYSELRAFVRAFKGWTGVPPGRFRQGG